MLLLLKIVDSMSMLCELMGLRDIYGYGDS